MNTWISLHRKFIEWEWYHDNDMVKLFIHLLLKANYKDGTWQGILIKRGQRITGLNSLSDETNISIQTLRTCLSRLEKTGEINTKVTNKYRIITICNYDTYQGNESETNKQSNKQLTINQQTTNKQLTTNNKENKVNKENNKKVKDLFSEQSPEIILSKLLFSLMQKNNPNAKQPNFQTWAKHIDLMIRIDKRPIAGIEGAIKWCQQNDFWHKVVLSTEKLRSKYDQLFLEAKKTKGSGNNELKNLSAEEAVTIQEIFCEEFKLSRNRQYLITTPGKDHKAIDSLAGFLKQHNQTDSQSVNEMFRKLFQQCLSIPRLKDFKFIYDRISPETINININLIWSKIQNGEYDSFNGDKLEAYITQKIAERDNNRG